MHRDIRWSNVMRTRGADNRHWFLIDFGEAAKSPQRFPSGDDLTEECHAPEIFVKEGEHTVAVDMWSVGYLIKSSKLWYDLRRLRGIKALVASLVAANLGERLTASKALAEADKLSKSR